MTDLEYAQLADEKADVENTNKWLGITIILLLIAASLAASGFFYYKNKARVDTRVAGVYEVIKTDGSSMYENVVSSLDDTEAAEGEPVDGIDSGSVAIIDATETPVQQVGREAVVLKPTQDAEKLADPVVTEAK